MYVSRLEIAGFKSFGSRIKLDLRPGVSAVVGPNGSGKSNIAEAIRWVLGAQNARDLRAQKATELIYAGSDVGKDKGRARSSMAEVILSLHGKASDTELGVEELVISRRLYRSGESEYMLGGRSVRLKDLQRILAQAGFGAASYTVIGQGMVDSLLIASPSERRLLFEEASGIRAFELQRIEDTRRLEKARAQAVELRAEIQVLAPEQAQLERQVKLLDRRREIIGQLRSAREAWLAYEYTRLRSELKSIQDQIQQNCNTQAKARTQVQRQETALKDCEREQRQANQQQTVVVVELEKLETEQRQIMTSLAQIQAEAQLAEAAARTEEKPASLHRALRADQNRLKQLQNHLVELQKKNASFEEKITGFNNKIAALNTELISLRQKLTANQRNAYLQQALGLARLLLTESKTVSIKQEKALESERVQILLHKLIRMVKLATEADLSDLPTKISRLQQGIARELSKREEIVEKQTAEIIKQRSIELDINALEKSSKDLEAKLAALPKGAQAKLTDYKQSQKKLSLRQTELEQIIRAKRQGLAEAATAPVSAQQIELSTQLVEARQAAQQAIEASRQLQIANDRLVAEEQALKQQAGEWRIVIAPDQSGAAERSLITKLEAELVVIGEVDEALAGAHTELRERLQYLESQAADIESASGDLEKVLAELERRIRKTFTDNFKKINQGFARYFKHLFHGGTAALELLSQADGSFGIEIVARPPGKRVEQLSSLSGGEKALSAIALLAAILDVNPSPFIVLDEVDAALDDANSRAFTELLQDLQKRSQLIVITHNHETMLQADELFGVTSSSKLSSTVVSIDLRQAEVLAES